jgi:putative transposase
MINVVLSLIRFLISLFKSRSSLALEVAALQHQIMVLKRSVKRPKISNSDRMLWVVLRRFWPDWRKALVIVQPSTVINWHRQGFRLYWRWKSRPKGGRPQIDPEIRKLIRTMWLSNLTWGSLLGDNYFSPLTTIRNPHFSNI